LDVLLAVAVGFATAQLGIFATSVYLHRSVAHSALTFHPAVAFVMRMIIWMTSGIIPRDWAGVHRRHHATVDTPDDPHSPRQRGLYTVFFANALLYRFALKDRPMVERYSRDLPPDKLDKWMFDHEYIGPALGVGLLCLVLGWQTGLLAGLMHLVFYVGLNSAVNSFCHMWGAQPNPNTATNLQLVGWLAGGEGLHNNHHAVPTAARLSWRAGERDPGWALIALLERLHLATVRHPGGIPVSLTL
jgi:stearoyl-CoA desaturase (delta-9 desaturase)